MKHVLNKILYLTILCLKTFQAYGAPYIPSFTLSEDSIKTYTTSTIVISEKIENHLNKFNSSYSKKIMMSEKINSLSVGKILSTSSGIFLKAYGGEGSLQTISLRGAGAEYTNVLINGLIYNNSINGVFDFSKFSSEEIKEIIIKKGNDFDVISNNSFGGAIELIPFEKSDSINTSLKFQIGSFGYQNINLKTAGLSYGTYYRINLSSKSVKNDYPYDFYNEKDIRKNSDVHQNSVNGAFINQFSVFKIPVVVNSFIDFKDKKMGLPTFVSSNRHINSGTKEIEKNLFYSTNSKFLLSDRILINGIIGFQSNKLHIEDPLSYINLKTTHFELNDNKIDSKILFQYHARPFTIAGGIATSLESSNKQEIKKDDQHLQDKFKRKSLTLNFVTDFEQNVGSNLRFNFALFISNNAIVNDLVNHKTTYRFSNLRAGISIQSLPNHFITFANIGTGTRVPNFYEYSISRLTSLSNNELEPEKILNYEFGLRFNPSFLSFEITYFAFDVYNKIIWRPQRVAFFSPRNAGRVKSSGVEVNLEELKISKFIKLNGNYTFTKALKKSKQSETDNSFNKQLPYIPLHKFSTSIYIQSTSQLIEFTINYFGRRFITEDNDILFSLDPVLISNLTFMSSFHLKQFRLTFNLLIQNLFNQQYLLIQSFPMPGREYRLTIQLEV